MLSLVSCSLTDSDSSEVVRSHVAGEWLLDRIDHAADPGDVNFTPSDVADALIRLTFDPAGRAVGTGPCNEYAATYSVDGGALVISDGSISAAACVDADGGETMMRVEEAVFDPLLAPKVHLLVEFEEASSLVLIGESTTWTFSRAD